jgi:hypothetical protein
MARKAQPKLTKADPDFYSKIARIAGEKLLKKKGRKYFSDLAKKSHKPGARDGYHGGRPKKEPKSD